VKARLCLVEDDPTISELVSKKLQRQGYDVDVFAEAEGVLSQDFRWDLYIIDVLLAGDMSGLELCTKIRGGNPTVPLLILSALSEPNDRIEGLKVGADDYLGKPFEMEELLLRIDGMLKRRSWYGKLPRNSSQFEWDDCAIDFVKFEGKRGGKRFSISQKECMLMKLLVERENEVISRDEILDTVWGYNTFPSNRTVDNFILRLRRHFDSPGEPRYIHSVRGTGYKFTSKGLTS
jgi:two-component system, OmpR family, alkaline phosphatase synthesis response regulator PhoP